MQQLLFLGKESTAIDQFFNTQGGGLNNSNVQKQGNPLLLMQKQ
jgi:hypothetical protein